MIPVKGKTFEETNYTFFVLYTFFCFSKIGRVFNQILKELEQFKAIFNVISSLRPFLSNLFYVLINIFLIFGQLGINFFGGKINSKTPAAFEAVMKRKLPLNYEFQNFNDFPNACVYLWNIFINNNWLDMSYMAIIQDDQRAYRWFFIVFILTTQFFIFNVITGFIIDIILSHLGNKYKSTYNISEEAIEAINEGDDYVDTSDSEESDENIFVDDEAEADLETKIRNMVDDMNKGLASNMKTFGMADKELEEDAGNRAEAVPLI